MDQANDVIEQVLAVADAKSPVPASVILGGIILILSIGRTVTSSIDEGFALVPHHTVFTSVAWCPIPFLWNFVTAHFFEANLLKALIVAFAVVTLTRSLERLWTVQAIMTHLLFTVACSGFTFFAAELIHVYRTHHDKEWFLSTRGCSGLIVALALAVRHAYPFEAPPFAPRSWGWNCQHLPFCVTLLYCLIGLILPTLMEDWPFAPLAFFFGWFHLRYMMWFPTAQAYGDHSPDFVFAALFPGALRPLLRCLGSITHRFAACIAPGFVQLRQTEVGGEAGGSIVYNPTQAASASPPIGGVPAGAPGGPGSKEYAARRAKALALLDQSISSFSSSATSGRLPAPCKDVELGQRPSSRSPRQAGLRVGRMDVRDSSPASAPEVAAVPQLQAVVDKDF